MSTFGGISFIHEKPTVVFLSLCVLLRVMGMILVFSTFSSIRRLDYLSYTFAWLHCVASKLMTKQSRVSQRAARHNRKVWRQLIASALVPFVLGIFTVVFTIQQQSLSKQQHEIDRRNQRDAQQQVTFDTYINDISNLLLHSVETNETHRAKIRLYVRTKTLTALRNLNAARKKYIILFLYESGLLQNKNLDLSGADLNDVQLIGPYKLDRLYLPGVSWRNALFVKCNLIEAVFNQSHMDNAQFIQSFLERASFPEVQLDNALFRQTSVLSINFTGASLVGANFLDAELVQGIDFSNTDLLGARFTDEQFRGQRVKVFAHYFRHSRLPNGSFGVVNPTRNLLKNGDAESEVSFV